jgi:SAM-dependent methyltransferase
LTPFTTALENETLQRPFQRARADSPMPLAGLARRFLPVKSSKASSQPANQIPVSQIKDQFYRLAREFFARTEQMGRAEVQDYYWYHTIDLGNGLITPGTYDYRHMIDVFQFPADMRRMSVFDVGSATGFFAFEFERRGADVLSLELPSLEALDCFPGRTVEQTTRNLDKIFQELEIYTPAQLERLKTKDLSQWYEMLMDGPFLFCRELLGSKVKRHYSRLYDLTPEPGSFDLVFIGDVLVHTINPLLALERVAALCRDTLIIAQDTGGYQDTPAFQYIGGDQVDDNMSWWLPNNLAFEQILRKLGFSSVRIVGKNEGQFRPMGAPFSRTIIHAKR